MDVAQNSNGLGLFPHNKTHIVCGRLRVADPAIPVETSTAMEPESSTKEEENVNVESYNSQSMKKARLKSTLAALLDDPILADVPKKPTLSDVDTLISLELGSAMRISVLKLDGTSFGTRIRLSYIVSSARHFIKHVIDVKKKHLFTANNFFFLGG